jgi:hypothetical protein
LYGIDVTFKWKRQPHRWLAWQTEFFLRQIPDLRILGVAHSQAEGAMYSQLVVQLARRWQVGVRGELDGLPRGDNVRNQAALSGAVTWALSEFSRVRLYGEVLVPFGPPTPNAMFVAAAAPPGTNGALFLQFEAGIGAHAAH